MKVTSAPWSGWLAPSSFLGCLNFTEIGFLWENELQVAFCQGKEFLGCHFCTQATDRILHCLKTSLPSKEPSSPAHIYLDSAVGQILRLNTPLLGGQEGEQDMVAHICNLNCRRLKQEDTESEASSGCTARPKTEIAPAFNRKKVPVRV